LAILPLFFVHIPQPESAKAEAQTSTKQSIWADMRDGLRYLLKWPGLIVLTAVAMTIKIVLTPAFSLIPLMVKDHFGGGAAQLSLLEAVVGGGFVAGGLILSVWGHVLSRPNLANRRAVVCEASVLHNDASCTL
jgi:DHA3 family macrolide efflux protein-like MFS transporter